MEPVQEGVTAEEYLARQRQLELEAREIMPYEPDTCTYPNSLRQLVFACLTCRNEGSCVGVCYSCSIQCHSTHDLVELFSKRDFVCDCGTERMKGCACSIRERGQPDRTSHLNGSNPIAGVKMRTGSGSEDRRPWIKSSLGPATDIPSSENTYNQNFQGRFCDCKVLYDPEKETQTMHQCFFGEACGEDWYHEDCIVETKREETGCVDKAGDAKEDTKKEIKEDVKKEIKEDTKKEIKEDSKKEIKEDTKKEIKEDTKKEIKEDSIKEDSTKEDTKKEIKEDSIKEDTKNEIKEEFKEDSIKVATDFEIYENPVKNQSSTSSTVKSSKVQALLQKGFSEFVCWKCVDMYSKAFDELCGFPKIAISLHHETNHTVQNSSQESVSQAGQEPRRKRAKNATPHSVFLHKQFRPQLSTLSDSLPDTSALKQLLRNYPFFHKDDPVYEPPEDDTASNASEGSLYDLGSSALSSLPVPQALEGLQAYDTMKEKLRGFFKGFVDQNKVVTEKEVREFFGKMEEERQK